jgi:diaminohydroxyphosphoribosylaminopyrimidine deaminase/5-amino-6-(5-phosphoribosylamino)uracil reductase
MQRCLQLASLGAGNVSPNPMVGAVLVHNDVIIGEGYHQQFGKAHAEVNCINSVAEANKHLISSSTMYVSLEPCAHFGKTPPCADLIIEYKIPTVVIGCSDQYHEVNGKGIAKLKAAGINVITGILEKEAKAINKRFFTFHQLQRPYIILKWAQSADLKIANADFSSVQISNDYSNRLVHKWRNEEAAIMVGTHTALYDNPSLTTRLWQGNNSIRVVIDKQLQLPATHQLFSGEANTIIFNNKKNEVAVNVEYCKMDELQPALPQILHHLYQQNIQSILVEGGAILLQSFIDSGLWDEARIITNNKMIIGKGIAAPVLSNQLHIQAEKLGDDTINYYQPSINQLATKLTN